jgi:hypothetical protein
MTRALSKKWERSSGMNWWSELARRLNMLLHRRRFDAELEQEMLLHLELRRLEQFEHGMPAEDAQAAARRRVGNTTYLREESHIVWGWTWLENLAQDIRFGARALLRERGVSAFCVLILALGIGAGTALYSVWKSALVFPFEFKSSGRWVAVLAGFNRQQTRSWFFSVPEFNDLRQLDDIFEGVTVLHHIMFNLTDNGHPESLDGTAVSADAIRDTGVQPTLGRSFLPGEGAPGGPNIVLLGYDLWQNRDQGDPNILGRQIRMIDESYTVVGVMPAIFPSGAHRCGFRSVSTTTKATVPIALTGSQPC